MDSIMKSPSIHASKDRVCDWCHDAIVIGDQYKKHEYKPPGLKEEEYRMHLSCAGKYDHAVRYRMPKDVDDLRPCVMRTQYKSDNRYSKYFAFDGRNWNVTE